MKSYISLSRNIVSYTQCS